MLSKDSTSMTKRQLHYKNKGCAFAVVESFASEAMSNKETETSMQSDPISTLDLFTTITIVTKHCLLLIKAKI